MSKLIINKHQICYIPEYNLYLQRVGVDNTSVRHTCERICSIYQIYRYGYCRNKTYVIDYFYEFIMPQTQQGILKDFNILLKDTTHFKCILRKI